MNIRQLWGPEPYVHSWPPTPNGFRSVSSTEISRPKSLLSYRMSCIDSKSNSDGA